MTEHCSNQKMAEHYRKMAEFSVQKMAEFNLVKMADKVTK
jgi:hypothetical protein